MEKKKIEIVKLQQGYYQDRFKLIGFSAAFLALIIVISILIAVKLMDSSPEPRFFRVVDSSKLLPNTPLTEKSMSDAQLLQWVTNVATRLYTYDFIHADQLINANKKYFSASGWKAYQSTLNTIPDYAVRKASGYFTKTFPSGAPSIINQRYQGKGIYWWEVSIPLKAQIVRPLGSTSYSFTINVLVIRNTSVHNNVDGVVINSIVKGK